MRNFDPFVVAVASCVAMLDSAGADEVEPSFAVKIQQVIGECLQKIPRSQEPELRKMLLRIADEVSADESEVAKHLRQWAANLGES
ncbi:hypothetical protein [Saccharomonospora xinjiangensis]|uniref:Uncharacterized protein n=1 Tax=Saccharomonospora xinjiangensis XJ-54 TaxID=882086 RepID=I0V339_9PSEU|nr:hypothetical protein [Saccharomonospora xinjiangensis]EID54542.1 hypothetical protein SacxiDRAFT_2313 [Saccharomonospora xinjiangensis XJ-54]